jgi:toxin ParE1/3/4
MRIRWTVPAADDLENIKHYLTKHFPHLAQPTIRRIYEKVRSLRTFPSRGRNGRRTGTRELVLITLPYIVAYRIKDDMVEILNVWHDVQDMHYS